MCRNDGPESHVQHNTLQHTATHCNTLQHTATHCNTLQHTATHHTAIHTYIHIRSLPETIGSCVAMMVLSLTCNQLSNIPDSFQECVNLTALHISSNRFRQLPRCVDNLTQVCRGVQFIYRCRFICVYIGIYMYMYIHIYL